MLTFDSFVNKEKKWELYLKNDKEMEDIYYEDQEKEEGKTLHGITEFLTSKVYINEKLNGFVLIKTLRHELMHIYLYEIDKRDIFYSEDEVCEILADAIPLINTRVGEIISKMKN